MEKCGYCMDEIEGGTFIGNEQRIYICSGECLDAYEKEKTQK